MGSTGIAHGAPFGTATQVRFGSAVVSPSLVMRCAWWLLVMPWLAVFAVAREPGTNAPPDRLQWWRDGKLGFLIQWEMPLDRPQRFASSRSDSGQLSMARSRALAFELAQAGAKYVIVNPYVKYGQSPAASNYVSGSGSEPVGPISDFSNLMRSCQRMRLRLGLHLSRQTVSDLDAPDRSLLASLIKRYPHLDLMWYGPAAKGWPSAGARSESAWRDFNQSLSASYPDLVIQDDWLRTDYRSVNILPEPVSPSPHEPWELMVPIQNPAPDRSTAPPFKTGDELVRLLCATAGTGGNLLIVLNLGVDGRLPPDASRALRQLGQWLTSNRSAIFGTAPFPLTPPSTNGFCTAREKRLFLHVFRWPNGEAVFEGLPFGIKKARLLVTGHLTPVVLEYTLRVREILGDTPAMALRRIRIPRPAFQSSSATVIELELDGVPQVTSR
jgi:hypothetical protein